MQILYDELNKFSEVFAAGTAAALVPIRSITSISQNQTQTYIEGEEAGPIVIKLLSTLKGIQLGKIEDKFGWTHPVPKPTGFLRRNAENGSNGTHKESVDELP